MQNLKLELHAQYQNAKFLDQRISNLSQILKKSPKKLQPNQTPKREGPYQTQNQHFRSQFQTPKARLKQIPVRATTPLQDCTRASIDLQHVSQGTLSCMTYQQQQSYRQILSERSTPTRASSVEPQRIRKVPICRKMPSERSKEDYQESIRQLRQSIYSRADTTFEKENYNGREELEIRYFQLLRQIEEMTQKVDDLRISNAVLESDLKEYKII